jgi:hypothetical protein
MKSKKFQEYIAKIRLIGEELSEHQLFLLEAKALGIESIQVEFEGSSDNGSIESVFVDPTRPPEIEIEGINSINADGITWPDEWLDDDGDPQWPAKFREDTGELWDLLCKHCPFDFVNDGGGRGTMQINVATGNVDINGYYSQQTGADEDLFSDEIIAAAFNEEVAESEDDVDEE